MKNQEQKEQQAKFNEEKGNQLIDEYNDKLASVHMPYFINREFLAILYFLLSNQAFYSRFSFFLDYCQKVSTQCKNVIEFIDTVSSCQLKDLYSKDEIDHLFKIQK